MFGNRTITLASASPRRRELLSGLDVQFSVEPNKDEKEAYADDLPWNEVPQFLAHHKSVTFHRELKEGEILITADTLVFLRNDCDGSMEIIGKPHSREEAAEILRRLSGHSHHVLTGVCLRDRSRTMAFTDSTEVVFRELTEEEINYYIDNYKPFDKAGAYGVQEWIGFAAITAIKGSYFNVMGLPVHRLYDALCEFCAE